MKTNPTMQAEAVLPTRPVSENGKINILTRLAYGGGDVACNVVYGMIATLLTLFYTDYAGVSVATVGLVMLISRFFDGGSDVVMGLHCGSHPFQMGTVPSVDPVDVAAVCAECDPAVQRTAHQRHDPVPVHLCHL